ncbi:MAG: tetratricopeptide repeat protein, partial [Planctomycetes bacterium]|nr:tetratricopeptide repeat protein [Planctomycetota bacterium]
MRYVGTLASFVMIALVMFHSALSLVAQQSQPANAVQELSEAEKARLAEAQSLWQQAQQLIEAGKQDEAIAAARKIIAIERDINGDDRSIEELLLFIVRIQIAQGDLAAIEKTRGQLLSIRTKLLGPEHWQTVETRSALEDVRLRQKLTREQLLEMKRADELHVQATTRFNEGNAKKGIEFELTALRIRQAVLGDDNLEVANHHGNVAFAYEEVGQLDRAEQYRRAQLGIQQQKLGTSHPQYIENERKLVTLLWARANQFRDDRQFTQSQHQYNEALAIRTARYGADDWRTREIRSEIVHVAALEKLSDEQWKTLEATRVLEDEAMKLYREEKYKEAAVMVDQALESFASLLGAADPETLNCISNRAVLAENLDDFALAEKYLRKYVAARLARLGFGHVQSRSAFERLADFLSRQAFKLEDRGEFEQAIGNRRERVQLQVLLFGERHWKATDARLRLRDTEALRKIPEEGRKMLASAEDLLRKSEELRGKGKFREAAEFLQRYFDVHVAILGKEHSDYSAWLNNLGQYYSEAGDYAKAELLLQESLASHVRTVGEEHPGVATTLHNLALLYEGMGQFSKAEQLCLKSLEIRGKLYGEQHEKFADGLGLLAGLYDNMGDYNRAIPLHLKALEIERETLGEDHPRYAGGLSNLAESYRDLGDYAKAEPLFHKSLEIRKKALGDAHPDYAISLNNLALLYQDVGNYDEAKSLFELSLQIKTKVLGRHHPDCANSLNNLANFHMQRGNFVKAKPLFLEALDVVKKAHGEQHRHYAFSLIGLATLYKRTGDIANAETTFKKSLEIIESTLGKEHPEYARLLGHLAGLAEDAGDYRKAQALYQEGFEIRIRTLGDEHPDVARSLNHVANLISIQGDHELAARLYLRSLEIIEKTLGPEHPSFSYALNNLGILLSRVGDFKAAKELLLRSREILAKTMGEKHPAYATCLDNLAGLHRAVGEIEQAANHYRKAISIHKTLLQATSEIQSERQQLAMAEDLRTTLDQFLSLAIEADRWSEQAFRDVLAWKGATLVRQRQMRAVGEDEDIAPLFEKLQKTAMRLATLSRLRPTPKQQVAWRRQIAELTVEKETLEIEL